jgi:hypothetical protein
VTSHPVRISRSFNHTGEHMASAHGIADGNRLDREPGGLVRYRRWL